MKNSVVKGMFVLAMHDENSVFLSKLNRVYLYDISTGTKALVFKFKPNAKSILSLMSVVVRRLLRQDIRIGIKLSKNKLLVVRNKRCVVLDIDAKKELWSLALPRGSRPLNITNIAGLNGFENGHYFGEYFPNKALEEVYIYKVGEERLEPVYKFPSGTINHVHNIIVDRHRDCVWILAGDFKDSSSIYQARDNFNDVKCIVSGKQIYRSCVAFPTVEGLVYATDSEFEKNTIRLLEEKSSGWVSTKICTINGPCIYGTEIRDTYYFSTSVEAINSGSLLAKYSRRAHGPGVIKNRSEIVSGNLKDGFETIYQNSKDIMPLMLFQYGNIAYPTGANSTDKLIFTPIATRNHDMSTVIKTV